MKKLILLSFIIILGIGCQKESTEGIDPGNTCTLPEMNGIWVGKWGEFFESQVNDFQFELKSDNIALINNGIATFEGEWHVEEFTFIATYEISGEVFKVKAPISATRLEGTWKNETRITYQGTFNIQKH
jgi:hypothetical protein